jgi:hypothetical protein
LDIQAALLTIFPKFVDDTKLGQVMRSGQGRQELQTSLDKLSAWAETRGLAFNVKKSMVMHFRHRNPTNPYYMMESNS